MKVFLTTALTTLVLGGAAQALPLGFDFEIELTSGALSGNTYTGTFVIDDAAFFGSGDEAFNPNGSAGGTLLSLGITVDGIAFSAADDIAFGTYPFVRFFDGVGTYMNFVTGPTGLRIGGYVGEQAVQFSLGACTVTCEGKLNSIVESVAAVPLPAALPMLLAGLGGLGLLGRRRARSG